MNRRLCVFWLFVFVSMVFMAFAQCPWLSSGPLKLPKYKYIFVSTNSKGDLLAVTFNANPKKSAFMPALLVKNPTSKNPKVIQLCQSEFRPQRGYSGVACDEDGSFYVAGDTGDDMTSFIRKFNSDGSSVFEFGSRGQILPKRRCQGIDIVGDRLFALISWGQIVVYDTKTGKYMGSLPKPKKTTYVRDIVIDQATMNVYGVAGGGVVKWSGGTPWEPEKYKFSFVTKRGTQEIRSGEGISFDPVRQEIIVSAHNPGSMRFISLNGHAMDSIPRNIKKTTHFGDSTISFDGNTLFVVDAWYNRINSLRRNLQTQSFASPEDQKYVAPKTQATLKWTMNYPQAVRDARMQYKPMIIYFYKEGFYKCAEIEDQVLNTIGFAQAAEKYTCVKVDVAKSPLLAYKLGIYRIPGILVLGPNGQRKARFEFKVDQTKLFQALR